MPKRKLSDKQVAFAKYYIIENGNGTKSARLAGYAGSDKALSVTAHRLLGNARILALLTSLKANAEKKIMGRIMSAEEVKIGLTRIAETDIADIFEEDGTFNLASAKRRGVSSRIKSMSFDPKTGQLTKIEVYSAHEGHRDMGKVHAIFVDKVEHSGSISIPEKAKELADLIGPEFGEATLPVEDATSRVT